jgi:predicted 3-demethylubiquinone-9 3-methyltransferase (glyoxalase superfamily)
MSEHKITPCVWFDNDAEQAIDFYSSVFDDLKVVNRSDWPEGSGQTGLLTATIELAGQRLMLLNGGPEYPKTEAFSLYLDCDDAAEVDYFWDALQAGGGSPSQCGWLKDRFGLSWQVVPRQLNEYLADPDRAKAGRVMQAMLQMTKIEVAELDAAYAGAVTTG